MSNKKVAINGFGRIGRLTFKNLLNRGNIEIVAVNDLTDVATLAHLLKYDTVHGRFDGDIQIDGNKLIVNGKSIHVLAETDPSQLPWKELGINIVLESTGRFTNEKDAGRHLDAGAGRVVISAPAKGNIPTIVLGVNDDVLDNDPKIVSNASCTTNCLAPMVKVLDDALGIEKGYITTVHAYTADQRLQDAPHKDLRRARAAACNVVPTTTGAAVAVGLVLPQLESKLDGIAVRVPVLDGSLTDLTCILKKDTSVDEVNALMKKAAEGPMKGIMSYTDEPLVSSDIIGDPHSCIFDSGLTKVNGNLIKIIGWYDNEAGYSNRVADVIEMIAVK